MKFFEAAKHCHENPDAVVVDKLGDYCMMKDGVCYHRLSGDDTWKECSWTFSPLGEPYEIAGQVKRRGMTTSVLNYTELLDDLRARVEKGKTQRDICAEAGIDETHFSGIINGKKIASRRILALLGYETVYRRRPEPETPK